MYIVTKVKNIKKTGNVYREEIKETHYRMSDKIIINPEMVLIKYKESNRDCCTLNNVAKIISIKDLIEIEILE